MIPIGTAILIVLGIIIALSAFFSKINAGILAIASAFLFGTLGFGVDAATILSSFPTSLVFILLGLSLFFAMLTENGTIERVAQLLLNAIGGRVLFVPIVVFALAALLTTFGVNNIAVTALVAPIAMKLAKDISFSPFLMAILIVGAVNGASFSPVSLSGTIIQNYVDSNGTALGPHFKFEPWKLFALSLGIQGGVAILGFHIFGGTQWIRANSRIRMSVEKNQKFEKNKITDPGLQFHRKHYASIAIFFLFVLSIMAPNVTFLKESFSHSFHLLTENVAIPAFIGVTLLMLLGVSDLSRALKLIPWETILLVIGMSMFIDFAGRNDALTPMWQGIVHRSNRESVYFFFPLAGAVLSTFSSSSGIVLPLFLPMVNDFVLHLPGVDAMNLISALSIASHLVDSSPLSTLGALCVAALPDVASRSRLFRSLLAWGLGLILVGAGLYWVLFSGIF